MEGKKEKNAKLFNFPTRKKLKNVKKKKIGSFIRKVYISARLHLTNYGRKTNLCQHELI